MVHHAHARHTTTTELLKFLFFLLFNFGEKMKQKFQDMVQLKNRM